MIDVVNALATGATVAGALKGISALEAFFARRNGTNGNKFSQMDHDALTRIEVGVDRLHDDLVDMRQDLRDCINAKR